MKDPKALEVEELLELVIVEPESNQDKQHKEDERFIIEKQLREESMMHLYRHKPPCRYGLQKVSDLRKGIRGN